MSYTWRQKTSPITSLLILQRAIDDCGFKIIETSNLMGKIKLARQRIIDSENIEEKITAFDELSKLIEECNGTSQLPESIKLDQFTLKLKSDYRYVVEQYVRSGRNDSSRPSYLEQQAIIKISKLNNSYSLNAIKLQDELIDAMNEKQQLDAELDQKLRQALIRTIKMEQESYKKSVKEAKEKIFQTIQENAKKEGYSVKRNVFTKGKNAGREQYVVVKRS